MRYLRYALLGLLASLFALLAVSPAPLAADHGMLSLTPVSDQPLATISLRHRLPGHPGQGERGQLASLPPACDKDVDLTSTVAGVIPIAAQDNLICTSSDIDTYVGQDGKTYVVQAGGQEAAWVHTDVSNPSAPVLIEVWLWTGPEGPNTYTPDVKAFSQGGRDYIALSLERLAQLAFCGVVIMDVTDPFIPTLVAQVFAVDWCDVHNVFVENDGSGDGRYVYLTADFPNDLRVLDIGDLNNISEIGRYTHPEASNGNYVHDVTVVDHGGSVGRRVYVSYWDAGLMILDASDLTPGVIESGSPNQPLNPDHSIDPPGFLVHHAFPSEDGARVFIQDEITFVAGFEPVQMWTTASAPVYVDGIELGGGSPADVPFVLPAHNVEIRSDLDLDGDGAPDDRLYVGWYKAGLQAFDFDGSGFITRRIYHQVQTEPTDEVSDGAWGVRLATIGADTYAFQSDRRRGLIIDKVDLCSAVANPALADIDSDGVINACDPCPANPDCDGDGAPDGADNCPDDANPSQTNTDAALAAAGAAVALGVPLVGDGLGDACDEEDDNESGSATQDPGLGASTCPAGVLPVWSDCVEVYLGTVIDDNCTSPPGPGGDALPPDTNMDAKVNIVDVGLMSPFWRQTVQPPPTVDPGRRFDLNADGEVNVQDVGKMASFWRAECA